MMEHWPSAAIVALSLLLQSVAARANEPDPANPDARAPQNSSGPARPTEDEHPSSRVVGIGGIFIKAKDPVALRAWYRDHLGMDIEDWGGMAFSWIRPDGPGERGTTIWSVFDERSEYFAQSQARFMVNYIVKDLNAVLAALRSEGCDVDNRTEESEFGKFGWVMDPEGNRIELWEPPQAADSATPTR